jgi:large conductance mechanosensitive channel
MGIVKEFKEFAIRGSVVDLAVGIIIGAAFTQIVNSLVQDVLMPPLGLVLGNVDFSDMALVLRQATAESEAVAVRYGAFINTIIHFVIVALAIFFLVKQINRLKRDEAPTPPTTRNCPYCISVVDAKATRCPNCTSDLAT